MTTPDAERAAALAAYKTARDEFDAAQEIWERYLDHPGASGAAGDPRDPGDSGDSQSDSERDSGAAELAFDRLKAANHARDDALDSLWVAWRNRPDPA